MSENDIIRRLLEKFRFTAPVPDDVRRTISARRKAGLVAILRMKKKYGVFIAPVIWFFFLARRMGITLSVAKCAVVVWTIALFLAGAVTTGVVYAVKQYREDPPASVVQPPRDPQSSAAPAAGGKDASRAAVAEPAPGLGVVPFEFIGVEAELAGTVTTKIGEGLIGACGARKVSHVGRSCAAGMARLLLLGSVVKLGDGYRITARVVDAASSRILVFASEEISSAGEMDGACGRIVEKVRRAVE